MADDTGNLIALDHGDGNPRAAILFKYTDRAGTSTFTGTVLSNPIKYVNVFTFQGSYGENYTGANLGGLEYSSTSYLVAGRSVVRDDDWGSHTAYNIFITVTDKDNFSSSGTSIRWITDYDTDGTVSVSAPQLVKLDSDSFLLLWALSNTEIQYVYLDGDGNMISDIYASEGSISDCQPIVVDGSVI